MRIITTLIVMLLTSNIYALEKPVPLITTSNKSEQFICTVKSDFLSIRLLILKHCPDGIANTDANQAVQAANLAEANGLPINNIGNFHITPNGRSDNAVTWKGVTDLAGLKDFISEQMKVDAEPGDTVIVYTIGHGGGDGSLMRLGQRDGVMKAIAEAAEENNQETLWWQLSCHAAARLPEISTLNEKQRNLFSMTASSPSNELSYFTTQGAQFKQLFMALSQNDSSINPDQDKIITLKEMRNFMIEEFGQKRGSLAYAQSDDEPIFGLIGIFSIPIVDKNSPQGIYTRKYYAVPKH